MPGLSGEELLATRTAFHGTGMGTRLLPQLWVTRLTGWLEARRHIHHKAKCTVVFPEATLPVMEEAVSSLRLIR